MRMLMRIQVLNQWLLSDAPEVALRHAAKPRRYSQVLIFALRPGRSPQSPKQKRTFAFR